MLYPSTDVSRQSSAFLEGILEEVQLGHLPARNGGLDTTRDWQDELSLGEQQVRWRRSALACNGARSGVGTAVALTVAMAIATALAIAMALSTAMAPAVAVTIAVAVAVGVAMTTATAIAIARQGKIQTDVGVFMQAALGRYLLRMMFVPKPRLALDVSGHYDACIFTEQFLLHGWTPPRRTAWQVFCFGATRCLIIMFSMSHVLSYTALIYSGTLSPTLV